MISLENKKNNMNIFCTPKPQTHKEYNMCDFVRNLKNQFEQDYATFVHVHFFSSNEMIHIPVAIDFLILIEIYIM